MKRLVIAAAALLSLALLPGSSHAFHHGIQYVRVPIIPGGCTGGSVGFGVTGFGFTGFGVPATGFGVPGFTGFGVPATGFGVPGFTGFGVPGFTGFGTTANAQGVFDQFILPLLLQRFAGGGSGGGTTATLTDAQIKSLADLITTQGGIKDLDLKVADLNKMMRALLKAQKVAVPDVVPPIGPPFTMNAPTSSPASEKLRSEFNALIAEIEAKQAGSKAAAAAPPREPDRLRAEFQALLAEIEAKQAAQGKSEPTSASPVVAGSR
jgi:hypothetical protein